MLEWYRLEEHHALQRPRRVMRYVLLWCTAGELKVHVDDAEFSLHPHEVISITSGQVHWIGAQARAQGVALEFSYDFFCKTDVDIELVFHNGLFCHFGMNEVIAVPEYQEFTQLLAQIHEELNLQPYQYLISSHARLELVLVMINRAKIVRGDEIWKPDALFLKFLEAVRTQFRQAPSLSSLAQQLQSTEAKLNELAKLHAGKTAQMVIYGLLASEAKRLLMYEKLSVKEVAAELGFNDPFYFSNFFKKHTGLSPKGYREKMLNPAQAFAQNTIGSASPSI